MAQNIVVANAHKHQLLNPEIKKEFDSISDVYSNADFKFKDGTVNLVFVKGIYLHTERKMITAFLLVNKMTKSIKEIHGEIKLSFVSQNAQIAKSVIDFDEDFLGVLSANDALLVHLGIPVRGLDADAEFTFKDIRGNLDSLRVTPVE